MSETRIPGGVNSRDVEVSPSSEGRPSSRIRVFSPENRAIWGALYVMPGVHHEGAADPRMERFCSVLANAGIVVGAPFIPDLVELSLTGRSVEDTKSSIEVFLAKKTSMLLLVSSTERPVRLSSTKSGMNGAPTTIPAFAKTEQKRSIRGSAAPSWCTPGIT